MTPETKEIITMSMLILGIPSLFFLGVFLGKTVTEWWLRRKGS